MRYVALLIAVFSMTLFTLSGCGGSQQQSPRAPATQPETTMAETTMETTLPSEMGATTTSGAETTASGDQYGQSSGGKCLDRQFAQATQGMNQQQAGDYETGVIDEAVNRQMDPRDIMTERGFSC